MAILKFKKVDRIVVECLPLEIKCDFCDEIINGQHDNSLDEHKENYFYEGGEVKFEFGYGSKFDMCTPRKIHMCDKCAEKIIFNRSE